MKTFNKLFTATALALCALLPAAATAQEVLLLATDGSLYLDHLTTAFTKAGANVQKGPSLTTGDIGSIKFSEYDTVIVTTGSGAGNGTIEQKNFNTLKTQIQDKNDPAFIIFSDGCNTCDGAFPEFASALGFSAVKGADSTTYSDTTGAQLNTQSAYSSYFSGLPTIRANAYGRITDADKDNRLYGADKNALAVFMPQDKNPQSTTGKSACTFLAGDLNIFQNNNNFPAQRKDVAETLLKNVQPGSAACTRNPTTKSPKVLFLSTEDPTTYFVNNTYTAFDAAARAAGSSGIADMRGALTSGNSLGRVLKESDFDDKNVVVIATKEGFMNAGYDIVEKMMQTRPDLSFIIFTDTCDTASATCRARGDATNYKKFEASLQDAISWDKLKLSHVTSSSYSAQPLNTSSPWASAFQGTNPGSNVIRSHVYGVMECIPARNKLFNFQPDRCQPINASGTNGRACTNPADGDGPNADGKYYFYGDLVQNKRWQDEVAAARHPDAAFTMLIPQWQSYASKGACIIFTDDINGFDHQNNKTVSGHANDMFDHQLQQPRIAERFLAVAMPGSGVCDEAKPADICPGIPLDQCKLTPASKNNTGALAVVATPDAALAAGGINCPAAVWCDSVEANRTAFCAAGESPSTHCCKTKAAPGGGAAAVPTTGWPALLGLSALLPLLARRQRRQGQRRNDDA